MAPVDFHHDAVCFNALYQHGVDEKRRIQIPAKWRASLGDTEFTAIVWPSGAHGACVRVLPPRQMQALMEEIGSMSVADSKAVALRRLIGSKSMQMTLDRAGRIGLPEWMAKAAGLEKEAVLVGLLESFEIWNPDQYRAVSEKDEELSAEAFKLI